MIVGHTAVLYPIYFLGSVISLAFVHNVHFQSAQDLFAEVGGCVNLLKNNSLYVYINIPNSLGKIDCPTLTQSQLLTACSNVLTPSELLEYASISDPLDTDSFQAEYFEEDLLIKHNIPDDSFSYPACLYVLKRILLN